jgi:ribonuclease E
MASTKTKEQLQAEFDEASDYIEELEGKLDSIAGIAADEDGDDDEDDADDDVSDDDYNSDDADDDDQD